jgi:hypothetical protein
MSQPKHPPHAPRGADGVKQQYHQRYQPNSPHCSDLHADGGAVDQTHAAYRIAIDSAHPEYAPLASLRLGASLWGAGRLAEANRAFAYTVEMGELKQAPVPV